MTDIVSHLSSRPLGVSLPLVRFIREALSHASGSLIAVALLLGSARTATIILSYWVRGGDEPLRALYRGVPSEIAAGCVLVAVLIAEQCVRNGAGRLSAYVPAVVIAAGVSGLIAAPLILLMQAHGVPMMLAYRKFGFIGTALFYSADTLARGGLAAFIFSNRERLLASIRHLRTAELKRTEIERDLANAHLLAVQATIKPETLLSTLETLRTLYERDRAEADRRLAEFIEHLRSVTVAIRV